MHAWGDTSTVRHSGGVSSTASSGSWLPATAYPTWDIYKNNTEVSPEKAGVRRPFVIGNTGMTPSSNAYYIPDFTVLGYAWFCRYWTLENFQIIREHVLFLIETSLPVQINFQSHLVSFIHWLFSLILQSAIYIDVSHATTNVMHWKFARSEVLYFVFVAYWENRYPISFYCR